ncbi:DNA-binding domain-containing protein [Pseudovibrio axinellae]|nr:DNA-binding domain-containing protein [Pseudovibrio axinellae]
MPQVSDSKQENRDLKGYVTALRDLGGNLRGYVEFSQGLLEPSLPVPNGVVGRDGAVSQMRYGVYRNNVMASLIDALAANFPALHNLVGRDYFRALAAEFVRAHPPEQPVLSEFGDKFSEFIAGFSPLANYPYLKDVATMEWAWLGAYHSADHEGMAVDALSKIDPELLGDVVFTAIPASSLVYSPFALSEIWEQNRSEKVTGVMPKTNQAILICRPDMDVTLIGLAQDVAEFAELLFAGETLGEAAEEVSSRFDTFDLSAALSCLLAARVFASVSDKASA